MKFRNTSLILVFGLFARLPGFAHDPERTEARSTVQSTYLRVHTFDAARNAEEDIEKAIAEAARTGKRVLLDIGGDWCPWCRQLDEFFRGNPSLLELREDNFITVAVYYGPDNENKRTLSRYPTMLGVPHFFVLEKDGTLLCSQRLGELQTNGSYSPQKVKEFMTQWSPPRSPATGDSSKTQ